MKNDKAARTQDILGILQQEREYHQSYVESLDEVIKLLQSNAELGPRAFTRLVKTVDQHISRQEQESM